MSSSKHSLHRRSRPTLPSGLRLERWQRGAVYLSVALLTLSGMAWIGAHYFFRPLTQFGETISPIEPWSMKLHGAAAMAGWFFFGSLLNGHIRGALRIKRNLASGWMMIALISLLTLSGYGLYYLAAESSRPFWSVIHWTIGCTLALGLAMHITLGRRKPV